MPIVALAAVGAMDFTVMTLCPPVLVDMVSHCVYLMDVKQPLSSG